MNILGEKVIHKTFGVGIIEKIDDSQMFINFNDETKSFVYPDAFEKFVKMEDEEKHNTILKMISEKKAAELEKRRIEEEERVAAAERKAAEEAVRRLEKGQNLASKSKKVVRTHRVQGKRMIFFVFQGGTFDKEYRGGYMWAPVSNKSGNTFHHWDRLLDVREGDIILHGCDGYVQAVSVAKTKCYDCAQPEELVVEDLWDREGRRVDCEYTYINNPIKTSTFREDILRLCNVKYAPFDKDGNGNMGYLFEINRELAQIFMSASVDKNEYLNNIDYVRELLSEELE